MVKRFYVVADFIDDNDRAGLEEFLDTLTDRERKRVLCRQSTGLGFTPVMWATYRGFFPVIELLLLPKYNVALNILGDKNETLLGIALEAALREELLQNHTKDPNKKMDEYIHLNNQRFVELIDFLFTKGLRLNPEYELDRKVQESIKKEHPKTDICKLLLKREQQDKGLFFALWELLNPPVKPAAIELTPPSYSNHFHMD